MRGDKDMLGIRRLAERRVRGAFLGLWLILCVCSTGLVRADIEIVLKKDFIQRQKGRVTIDATYFVDKGTPGRTRRPRMATCTLPGGPMRSGCRWLPRS